MKLSVFRCPRKKIQQCIVTKEKVAIIAMVFATGMDANDTKHSVTPR